MVSFCMAGYILMFTVYVYIAFLHRFWLPSLIFGRVLRLFVDVLWDGYILSMHLEDLYIYSLRSIVTLYNCDMCYLGPNTICVLHLGLALFNSYTPFWAITVRKVKTPLSKCTVAVNTIKHHLIIHLQLKIDSAVVSFYWHFLQCVSHDPSMCCVPCEVVWMSGSHKINIKVFIFSCKWMHLTPFWTAQRDTLHHCDDIFK